MFDYYFSLKNNVGVFAEVFHNGRLWISHSRFNGLFSIDIDSHKTVFHGRFLNAPLGDVGLHWKALEYENKLFFFRRNELVVDVYDIKKNSLESIGSADTSWLKTYSVGDVVLVQDDFWVLPKYNCGLIFKFSCKERKFSKSIKIDKAQQALNQYDKPCCVKADSDGINIVFPIWNTNKIVVLDTNSCTEKIVELGLEMKCFSVAYWMKNFYIQTDAGLLVYSLENEKTSYIDVPQINQDDYYSDFCFGEKYAYFLCGKSNSLLRMNMENYAIELNSLAMSNLKRVEDEMVNWRIFKDCILIGNHLFIMPVVYNQFIEIRNCQSENPEIITWQPDIDKSVIPFPTVDVDKYSFNEKNDLPDFVNYVISKTLNVLR